ncbi:hypothetical protein JR316_0008663 [Psilocybe cubensis]|uniref:Uncharacterized protein n=1 Tax=Psilocybe cubensis TaxID=181762 RepID=A0ACB8GR55_PSICU|nr:hypothetical protein JR316_0008663 [Psilocybe cubensis]KAH9478210.1 hypothetical protein JR316_0008663 [Psilocybe cubensis]
MSEKPQRVKTWYIEESDLLTVSLNPDSDGIRIAVENEGANTARHISVFEYHPSSGRSNEWIWNHFHETENVVVDLITMSCNYLLIATSAHVCVWDFVNDKEAMWTYDRLGIKSRTLSNVMLDTEENVVILFTFNRVICWKILPLGMKEAGISSVCHHDKMELVFDINFEKPRFPGRTPLATDFKRVADWYKITPSSRIFDIRLNFRSRSDTRKWIWTGYQVVDTPVPGPQSETNSSGTHTNLQSIYKVVRLEHWSTHTESQGVLSSIEHIDDDDDSDGDDNDNEGEGDSVHQYGSYVDVTRFGLEGDEERYNSGDDGNRPTILDGGEEYDDAIENDDEVQPDTENDDRYYSSGSEDFFFEFGEGSNEYRKCDDYLDSPQDTNHATTYHIRSLGFEREKT